VRMLGWRHRRRGCRVWGEHQSLIEQGRGHQLQDGLEVGETPYLAWEGLVRWGRRDGEREESEARWSPCVAEAATG